MFSNKSWIYIVLSFTTFVCCNNALQGNFLLDVSMKIQQANHLDNPQLANDLGEIIHDVYRVFTIYRNSDDRGTSNGAKEIKNYSDFMKRTIGFLQNPITNETVSSVCINDLRKLIIGLLSGEKWAFQFFDASGKPGPALTQYHLNFVGNYDQCRKASSSSEADQTNGFEGNYCSIGLGTPNPILKVMIGACLPTTCSSTEISSLLRGILVQTKLKNIGLQSISTECLTEETEFTTAAVISIVILVFLGVTMFLGTAYDILMIFEGSNIIEDANMTIASKDQSQYIDITGGASGQGGQVTRNDETSSLMPSSGGKPISTSNWSITLSKIFLAFSVYSNSKKILKTNQLSGSLGAIHGIRFLSMTWVVLCHFYLISAQVSSDALHELPELLQRWTFLPIVNGFPSVDTFFTLSGLLTSYLTMKEMLRKNTWKINWLMFYFHRLWRLTPPYMLVIVIILGLQQYMGKGPFWSNEQPLDKTACENNWWTNLLYVNNLVKADEMCLQQSWYLANDMQFFVLSPLMLIPFFFHRLAGIFSCCVFLLATMIATGVLSTIEDWPTTLISLDLTQVGFSDWMEHYYIVPWCRIGPFIVGIIAGYFLALTEGKLFAMKKWVVAFGWIISLSCGLAIVYGLRGDITGDNPSSTSVAALYNAVSRSVWGACVSWVIIACSTGHGGPVNKLLSWSPFVVLGRLTYMSYLIHFCILEVFTGNLKALITLNDTTMVITFLGILVFVNMASFICVLALESPMVALEKIFIRR